MFKSINWYLDIDEYELPPDLSEGVVPSPVQYNSFSIGPIKRSWGYEAFMDRHWEEETTLAREASIGAGFDFADSPHARVSVQQLVNEINQLLEAAWNNGIGGRTKNLYQVVPSLIVPDVANKYPVVVINFKFIRTYPPVYPGQDDGLRFRLAFNSGPHGQDAPPTLEEDGPSAIVEYTNKAHAVAALLPYWEADAVIADKPPVPPDVVFVPFLGISDKILVLLDANIGDLNLAPVMITDSDTNFLVEEMYSQHQVSVPADQVREFVRKTPLTLNYKSDDPVRAYQIFRLSEKPTSYSDFNTSTNPIAKISTLLAPNKRAVPGTFIDSIQPNTKYYYCVRGVDVHGNISNPTEVFVIEMVDNNGQIFYTKKVLNMGAPPAKICKVYGQRFIGIEPSPRQLIFNREAFNNSNDVQNRPENIQINDLPPSNVLGNLSEGVESVWGKKFKVRVTSAKTGKKFDLNITIKNTGVTNP